MKGHPAIANRPVAAGEVPQGAADSRGPRLLRHIRFASLAILVPIGLFAGGFGLFAHHIGALATPENLESADAIIVLTGGHSRIGAALDLLKSGKGRRLLISGVNPIADDDDLLAASGADAGLFMCCVDIDRAAVNTIGNAAESAKWVRANAYESVILVTNNYHMPRSLLEMRRYLEKADLKPYPVVNTPLDNGNWLTKPRVLRVLLTEYAKFLAAVARSLLPVTAQKTDPALEESTVVSRAAVRAR